MKAEIKATKTGFSLDSKSLKRLGSFGKLILDHRDLVAQKRFLLAIEENLNGDRIHIPIKMSGTITGRCSSGNLEGKGKGRATNLLALPKRPELWECFIPNEGYELVHFDFASLEPHVLAYMTQDKNMLKLYGPDAKPHCVYLFVAAFFPTIRDKVLEHYNLDGNGTEENLERIKGILKKERKMTKAPYLGSIYGLGAEALSFDAQITYKEAVTMLNSIEQAFPGKGLLHNHLVKEWTKNGGWVTNVRGRPVCVPKNKLKDIVNRVTQSGGSDILYRLLFHINTAIKFSGIDAKPYIASLHDESIFMVRYEDVQAYKDIVNNSFNKLNDELGWNIKFKHGGVTSGEDCSIRCD